MPPLEICRPGPGPLLPVRKYGPAYSTTDNVRERQDSIFLKDFYFTSFSRCIVDRMLTCRFYIGQWDVKPYHLIVSDIHYSIITRNLLYVVPEELCNAALCSIREQCHHLCIRTNIC
jgi:hypothetical protein